MVEDTAEAFMKANEDIELELYCMPENKNWPYIESLKILAAQKEFFDIVEMRETPCPGCRRTFGAGSGGCFCPGGESWHI